VATDPDSDDRGRCTACGGSGEVISTEGGEPRRVRCPWCDGTGRFIPGHDAQAARRG
jgi:DnaJ-class molecular chaperone